MRLLLLCSVALLAGCGDVTITQVDADGKKTPGAREGFYVPRLMPYLIVADLPADQTQPKHVQSARFHIRDMLAADTKPKAAKAGAADAAPADKTTAPAATSSDLSFQAVTKQYSIKLVYLPDYSHQQAIQASSGLFGKASLQMQLIDGTLSSFSANSDNTENGEVFKAALTAAITAASGGAAGGPAAAAGASSGAHTFGFNPDGGSSPAPNPRSTSDSILHPGIYQLVYNSGGYFVGLKKVTGFCSATGTLSAKDATLKAEEDARARLPAAETSPLWGSIADQCKGVEQK